MSKLQKALEMLRNSERSVTPKRTPDAAKDGADNAGGAVQRNGTAVGRSQRARIHSRYLPKNGVVVEQLPDFSISLSLDELRDHGLQPQDADLDLIAQQFRRIKRPILNNAFGSGAPDSGNRNLIMLAGALPRTGKTFCSFNLATSIARERDVGAVLVDADVLKPTISEVFGLADRAGLIDYLLDPAVTMDDILVATDLHGIIVVPAGRQHDEATELLASRRMKEFMAELSVRYSARAIIVDTPPLLLTNEANVLAELMGQIILVIEAGVSTQDSVIQALDALNKTKPINVILNKARSAAFGEYGGSGYGYGYMSVPQRGQVDGRKEK